MTQELSNNDLELLLPKLEEVLKSILVEGDQLSNVLGSEQPKGLGVILVSETSLQSDRYLFNLIQHISAHPILVVARPSDEPPIEFVLRKLQEIAIQILDQKQSMRDDLRRQEERVIRLPECRIDVGFLKNAFMRQERPRFPKPQHMHVAPKNRIHPKSRQRHFKR